MTDLAELVDQLSGLTVMEAMELVRTLETKWGVSGSAAVSTPSVVAIVTPVEPIEEQTEFCVTLTAVISEKRIGVIKEIRTLTGLALGAAKEFVEGIATTGPKVIREIATKEEAEKIKTAIEAVGGTVEIT